MLNFTISSFLRDYWQKKPCVIRNALPHFTDFIDEHELAGLAMETEFDSRIISKHGNEWSIAQGPFENFDVCQGEWTLLVQGIDKYVDEASELMDLFNFIPNWRIDDLMISFAVPGAGVGPHVDQYDVFLLQGKGQRRWRVGEPDGLTSVQPTAGLCQVENFEPVIDCELNPGDILYIPPGWPHDGIALQESLTYSVGFRAPDQAQLSTYLAESLQSGVVSSLRYSDAELTASTNPALVEESQLTALKSMLHQAIDSEQFSESLLTLLSEQGVEPDSATELEPNEIQQALLSGEILRRRPGCRPLLNRQFPNKLFINGEVINFAPSNFDKMAQLVMKTDIDRTDMTNAADELDIFCAFTKLVAMGYWELSPAE